MAIRILIDEDEVFDLKVWAFLVKRRAKLTCERCGSKPVPRKLHAHHKDHDPRNSTLRNGECLCAHCHGLHHGLGRRKWSTLKKHS